MAKDKILLIEDDPDQIFLYTAKFTMEGFDFVSAKNGLEGIDKAVNGKPDLILCDIVMDEMDGMEVLTKLKENKQTKKIPIVMLTNLLKKDLIKKSEELGAVGFWPKTDVLPQELVDRVKKILKIK